MFASIHFNPLFGKESKVLVEARKAVDPIAKCRLYSHAFEHMADNKMEIGTSKDIQAFAKSCSSAVMLTKAIDGLMRYMRYHPSPLVYLSTVKLLEQYGAIYDAFLLARKSTVLYPHDVKLVKKAIMLTSITDRKTAESFVKYILKKNQKNGIILLSVGNFYVQHKQWHKALQIYKKVYAISQLDKKASYNIQYMLKHGFHIGDTVLFPTDSQYFIENKLFDKKQMPVVSISDISGKSISKEAEKFVKTLILDVKNKKTYFTKNDRLGDIHLYFVYGEFLIPRIKGKKLHYKKQYSIGALGFKLGGTSILLSINRTQMDQKELYKYLYKIMTKFALIPNIKKVLE